MRVSGKRPDWDTVVRPHYETALQLADRINIALICTVKGRTEPHSDYDYQSIESRFYSEEEAEHFLEPLRGAGYNVSPFFEEKHFIDWVQAGKHTAGRTGSLLAIATGSSFSGIGSKSLVPAFCRLHGIAIAGPDPHSASLARHKYHLTLALNHLGEITPETWCFSHKTGWLLGKSPPQGMLVVLKLAHEGASIGLDDSSVVEFSPTTMQRIKEKASQYSQPILVQELIAGYEIEVPIFHCDRPRGLSPVGISVDGRHDLGSKILTYELSGADRYGFWIPEERICTMETSDLVRLAERCAELLWLRDLCRIDFRIDRRSGSARVIDVSTSPYISPHSSFAFLAKAAGYSPSVLPLVLVGIAARRLGLGQSPPDSPSAST